MSSRPEYTLATALRITSQTAGAADRWRLLLDSFFKQSPPGQDNLDAAAGMIDAHLERTAFAGVEPDQVHVQVYESSTRTWHQDLAGSPRSISELSRTRLATQPLDVLGHVLDINQTKGVRSRWGLLFSRLRANNPPPDDCMDKAKRMVREQQDKNLGGSLFEAYLPGHDADRAFVGGNRN